MEDSTKYFAKVFGVTIAVSLPIGLAYMFAKKLYSKDEDSEINEVMFFSNSGLACRSHFMKDETKKLCLLPNCSFRNLSCMLDYLNNAEQSLDVCLYLITVRDLGQAIIKAQKRGVKVRVITDEDMANGSGSMILSFRQNGLAVRNQRKSTTLMHHKFVIIDNKILMQGSLNWTMQAICGNWDNLLITSSPPLVRGYLAGFHRLWEELK